MPGGVPVNYCSWASHRLPDVWPEPDAFRPERFAPGNRERIPKGAYVPFGGGSRMCIGMRFGQAEVGVIAAAILERFRLELAPGLSPGDPPDADHRPQARDADGAACGQGRAGRPSPPSPRSCGYLPTFTVSTPEPSPLERKSPAHWATKRLLPLRTRQLVVYEPLAAVLTVWCCQRLEPGGR